MKRLNLLLFRKRKGLNQKAMADKLEITRQHYNRLENGVGEPSIQLLEKFAAEFSEVDDLWELWKKSKAIL